MGDWKPTIIAHRGGAAGFGLAENSREAFAAATAAGFGSECDVWQSADEVPVVMHDERLDRTTLAQGRVTEYSAQTLRQVYLRTSAEPARVPLLREVADDVSLIEIKQNNAPELVRQTIEIMGTRPCRLQSFDAANVRHAQALAPAIPVAYLVYDMAGIDRAIAAGWPAYMEHKLLDEAVARRLRDAGLSIGVWTVNSEQALRRLVPFRPDVIISDVPLLIREWLGRV